MPDTGTDRTCPNCYRPVTGRTGLCAHCGAHYTHFGALTPPGLGLILVALVLFGIGALLAAAGGGCGLLIVSLDAREGLPVALVAFAVAAVGVALCVAALRLCRSR